MSTPPPGPPQSELPRYLVFIQEHAGGPFALAGSVHAADDEMALQNGRDVYARRPAVSGLWVVRDLTPPPALIPPFPLRPLWGAEGGPGGLGLFHIFVSPRPGLPPESVAQVQAPDAEQALALAREQVPAAPPGALWLAVAEADIRRAPDDPASWFAPAEDKPFRLSSGFRTVTAMRGMKTRVQHGAHKEEDTKATENTVGRTQHGEHKEEDTQATENTVGRTQHGEK